MSRLADRPAVHRRALLLDALGTLVALAPPAPVLRRILAERWQIDVGEQQSELAIAAEIAYYRAHLDEGRDAVGVTALRRRCAEVLRAALPPSPRLDEIPPDALTSALLASLRFSAFPDARPAIAAARAGGQRVVVVSNWDVSLTEVLERLALAPLLDGVVTSAEAGVRKPARAIFEQGLRLAGTEPGAAAHVGDRLQEDILGARAAGIEAILIRRDGNPGPPGVRTIATLAELANASADKP